MMKRLRQAIGKFAFLAPLHAMEFAMGWFMTGTGLWIAWPVVNMAHPLTDLLRLGHLNSGIIGSLLVLLGLSKCFWAFLDFQAPTERLRKLRVATAFATLTTWALVLVNGFLWHGAVLLLRYVVLFTSELWIIITGAHSRPGGWE